MPYVAATRDAAEHVARQAFRPFRKWTVIFALTFTALVAACVASLLHQDSKALSAAIWVLVPANAAATAVWPRKFAAYRYARLDVQRFDNDVVMSRVADAVAAAKTGERAQLGRAFEALAPLDTGEVLVELFLRINEATAGVDLDALLAAAKFPPRLKPRELVNAARRPNLAALSAALDEPTPERMFSTLVVLVAALEDARRRL